MWLGRDGRGRRLLASAAVAASLLLSPAGAAVGWGQEAQGDAFSIDLTGYLRSLTAHHDLGFELPGVERTTLLNSQVGRLMWTGRWGERVSFVAHNRLVARVSFSGEGFGGGVAGLGVSVVPQRSIELGTTLVDNDDLRVFHDIDRLAVTVRTRAADVTVGRQAITWGFSGIFPVADLWAQFSPFELDTEEKPGIDAVRALAYPGDGVEVDIVVADRGSWRDLSAGARVTFELASGDVYAGAGKFWDRLTALGGATYLLERTALRAEAALPWRLDDGRFERPRVTLGVDRLGARLTLSAEYHYNGIGARGVDGYFDVLGDPRLRRGETYFLARHYLGGMAAWTPDTEGRLTVTASVLGNLTDRSVALAPSVHYDLGQRVRLTAGAVHGLGQRPSGTGGLGSEFGGYGRVGWVGGVVFF